MRAHQPIQQANTSKTSTNGKKINADVANSPTPLDTVLSLHSTLGNREVQRLVESGALQPKLTVGAPNDIYEQEADRVADQVMRMPETPVVEPPAIPRLQPIAPVQRMCPECEEELQKQESSEDEDLQRQPLETDDESLGLQRSRQFPPHPVQRICSECEGDLQRQEIETEDELQRHLPNEGNEESLQRESEIEDEPGDILQTKDASAETPSVTSEVESRIHAQRGGGQPLPASSRDFFGPRIGADFSSVRVHANAGADTLNRQLNARAFTTGQDIFFRRGEYNPGSSSGQKLLAHELTHVVQQNGSKVQRHSKNAPLSNKRIWLAPKPNHGVRVKRNGEAANKRDDQQNRSITSATGKTPVSSTIEQSFDSSSSPPFSVQRLCSDCEQELQTQPLEEPEDAASIQTKLAPEDENKERVQAEPGQLPLAKGLIPELALQRFMDPTSQVSARESTSVSVIQCEAAQPSASTPVSSPTAGTNQPSTPPAGPSAGTATTEATSGGTPDAGPASGEVPAPPPGGAQGGGESNLLMPEPPEGLSEADEGRLEQVETNATEAASNQEELPSAEENVLEAREGVDEPAEETTARAEADLAAALGSRPEPSPEIEALCARIREVIRSKRPPDEDSLVDSDPSDEAEAAGDLVESSVEGDVERVESSYDELDEPQEGEPQQIAEDVELPPESVETPEIGAQQAVPDPVPDEDVSLDADVEASASKMEDAGMNTEPAQLVESGPIAEARGAQGELSAAAERDPAEVLAEQQEARAQASADMAALQQQAVETLLAARAETVTATGTQQEGMVGSEEQMRTRVSAQAQSIFDNAQTRVNTLLEPLTATAMRRWETGVEVLSTQFEQDLARVKRWIDERYSGVGGAVLEVVEDVIGMPGWVTEAYNRAEQNFGDGVCELIREISAQVNGVIETCETIIDDANRQINDLFTNLPESLQEWAAGEQARFTERLDELHNQVTSTRDDFNQNLAQRASQSVQEVRERIHALRQEARGLIGRIEDAVNQFLEDPAKFIIDGLLELVGIPPPSFWALINRIQSVIASIADDPMNFANNLMSALGQGFQSFFDNFAEHMLDGLLDWLFSGLGSVGVEIPGDFSLESVITFFLQLMGISWENIREILARHIGEENVALLEKAYELIANLIEMGPQGMYEMIKEQLDPQTILDQVIQAAIDYLIEALITQVTARIIALFNPAGAIVQAVEAIYRVLSWIFNNAARIFSLVETVVNGAADLIAGNIGGMATAVEGALARLIAPVIDFLAGYVGLGDLPEKIADTIRGFQQWILGIIDRVVGWLAERARGLLAALGIGETEGEDDDEVAYDDPEKEAQVRAGLAAIDAAEQGYLDQGKISREEAEQVAASVKRDHPVFTRLEVVDGGDRWNYDYAASPGKTKQGEEKEENAELPVSVNDRIKARYRTGLWVATIDEIDTERRLVIFTLTAQNLRWSMNFDVFRTKYAQGVEIMPYTGQSAAEELRSESEMREELGPAEPGKERHHLIPLSVAASHPLVQKAIERGIPPYRPNSGLVYLPKDEAAAQEMPGLPIHSGSHPRWSARVRELLDAKQTQLSIAFGSLDQIPERQLTSAVRAVQNLLRNELGSWSRLE